MDIDLRILDSTQGFRIKGSAYDIHNGIDLNKAGDINKDGFDDLIIGSGLELIKSALAAKSYMIFGRSIPFNDIDLNDLEMPLGFKLTGYQGSFAKINGFGDINKDGFDDLITGSPFSPFCSPGSAYVLFGNKTNFFNSTIDINNIKLPIGFKIYSYATGDCSLNGLGAAVSTNVDINGDGFSDIIVGALDSTGPGASYVIFGKSSGFNDIKVNNLVMPIGFKITGSASKAASGSAISRAGDINGDGFDDIVIGEPYASPLSRTEAGASYVIFGKASGFSDIALRNLTQPVGFKILGAANYDHSGTAVSGAGDINKDGFDDIIIGAPGSTSGGEVGISYVIFGKASGFVDIDLASLGYAAGFRIVGTSSDQLGFSVGGIGDINKDGFDDLIIGAYNSSFPDFGRISSGVSYVIFGKQIFTNIELTNFTESQGFRIIGANDGDNSGRSVSGVGDINNDGVNDIIIGAPNASPLGRTGAGISYIVYGQGSSRELDLSKFDGTQGFKNLGAAQGDQSGNAVSGNFDLNGDGVADIAIGANHASPLGRTLAGEVKIIYGKKAALSSNNIDVCSGFKIHGENSMDGIGYAVSLAGDINSDGKADIIISAPQASFNGRVQAGINYIIYGNSSLCDQDIDLQNLQHQYGFKVIGALAGDSSGSAVSNAGDINGDGISDLVIGANNASPLGRIRAGEVYILYGRSGGYSNLDLSSLFQGKGFKVIGANNGDALGSSVHGGFDINKDGISDIVIGAPQASPLSKFQAGISYVIFGRNDSSFGDIIDLGDFNSFQNVGLQIIGAKVNDLSGQTVTFVTNTSNHQVGDLVISAPQASCVDYGCAGIGINYHIYSKTNITSIDLDKWSNSDGFRYLAGNGNCSLLKGSAMKVIAVSDVGDVSGDGISDLIIGVGGASASGRTQAGISYVVYGRKDGHGIDINLNTIYSINGAKVIGANSFDASGTAVSGAGDLNGDGINDIVIGVPYASPLNQSSSGESFIIYGGKVFNDSYKPNLIGDLLNNSDINIVD